MGLSGFCYAMTLWADFPRFPVHSFWLTCQPLWKAVLVSSITGLVTQRCTKIYLLRRSDPGWLSLIHTSPFSFALGIGLAVTIMSWWRLLVASCLLHPIIEHKGLETIRHAKAILESQDPKWIERRERVKGLSRDEDIPKMRKALEEESFELALEIWRITHKLNQMDLPQDSQNHSLSLMLKKQENDPSTWQVSKQEEMMEKHNKHEEAIKAISESKTNHTFYETIDLEKLPEWGALLIKKERLVDEEEKRAAKREIIKEDDEMLKYYEYFTFRHVTREVDGTRVIFPFMSMFLHLVFVFFPFLETPHVDNSSFSLYINLSFTIVFLHPSGYVWSREYSSDAWWN